MSATLPNAGLKRYTLHPCHCDEDCGYVEWVEDANGDVMKASDVSAYLAAMEDERS